MFISPARRKDTGRIPEGCQTSVKRHVRKPGIALQLYLHAGRIPEGYRKDTGRDEKKRNPDTGLNEFSHIWQNAFNGCNLSGKMIEFEYGVEGGDP